MPIQLTCRGVLFDLDGVLVDSRASVEEVWRIWAAERNRDPDAFIRVAHGRRISETLRMVAPELDIARETAALDDLEGKIVVGLRAIPGATELVASLPSGSWGIVTSGSTPIARLRLELAGLPVPQVFITAEQVKKGKPDPQGYITGAERLGISGADCLVFEDAPPGIAAAKAAGMRVVGVLTTHEAAAIQGVDALVPDLTHVSVGITRGDICVLVYQRPQQR